MVPNTVAERIGERSLSESLSGRLYLYLYLSGCLPREGSFFREYLCGVLNAFPRDSELAKPVRL
jgi:hypothetical protein